jgi:hypothetical protein
LSDKHQQTVVHFVGYRQRDSSPTVRVARQHRGGRMCGACAETRQKYMPSLIPSPIKTAYSA